MEGAGCRWISCTIEIFLFASLSTNWLLMTNAESQQSLTSHLEFYEKTIVQNVPPVNEAVISEFDVPIHAEVSSSGGRSYVFPYSFFPNESILSYNGGIVIAMKGKNCVAIAGDRRLGVRGQTVALDFQKIFEMGPRLYLGLPGLATDTITVAQRLKFRLNLYELRENRQIKPKTFGSIVSNLLYEKRFSPYFVEPVIAGLEPITFDPFVCNMDVYGFRSTPQNFVVGGTGAPQACGMCESLWEPSLEPDDLFEKISQALVNACDRDAISGWGGIVHVIEKDRVTTKKLKTRMD